MTLPPSRTGRVLVLGNAGIDLVMPVPRLPRPGETLVGAEAIRAPGGKGLNQAVMAARAGATVHLLAPLGNDADGAVVAAALAREPIARLSLPRPGPGTDLSVVLVGPDGENCIATSGACADALDTDTAAMFAAGAAPGDVLLLQGNLSRAATLAAARHAAAAGAYVLLNPAPLRWDVRDVLPCCAAVVANEGEATAITGVDGTSAAESLRRRGPPLAIVTLGAQGCAVAGNGIRPALPVCAVDTTGAGDAFCGTLAAALALGFPAPNALDAAMRAAADTCTRPGAYAALPPRMRLA